MLKFMAICLAEKTLHFLVEIRTQINVCNLSTSRTSACMLVFLLLHRKFLKRASEIIRIPI